jgi:hypothetical protein
MRYAYDINTTTDIGCFAVTTLPLCCCSRNRSSMKENCRISDSRKKMPWPCHETERCRIPQKAVLTRRIGSLDCDDPHLESFLSTRQGSRSYGGDSVDIIQQLRTQSVESSIVLQIPSTETSASNKLGMPTFSQSSSALRCRSSLLRGSSNYSRANVAQQHVLLSKALLCICCLPFLMGVMASFEIVIAPGSQECFVLRAPKDRPISLRYVCMLPAGDAGLRGICRISGCEVPVGFTPFTQTC